MKRGELLSDKRIEKGFSVSVLAQKLGVAEADVERWEAGELPDSKHLLALSALLDIPVEDILQGGIAAEEGEGDAPKDDAGAMLRANTGERDAGGTNNSVGGIPREEAALPAAAKKSPARESYYEKLHKKIRYSDDPSSPDYQVGGSSYNGYLDKERKFGYIVFAVFLAVLALTYAVQLVAWLTRPREVTMENYRDFLEIAVEATGGLYNDYVISVTAKKEVSDLRITIQVRFGYNFIYDDHEGFFETVTIAADLLSEGETAEETVHFSGKAVNRGTEVLSVEGGLA